jgi:hypothetical protein
MALFRNQGNQVTVAPGATAFTTWSYPGLTDHGPQYLSADFVGAESNFGTVTTTQVSVVASFNDSLGYYWPTAISYAAQTRNDGELPVLYTVSIGNFE